MKNRLVLKTYIVFIISLLSSFGSFTLATSSYYFKQISLQDGLTQSTVRSVLYDSDGYLWIATKSGLNRYEKQGLRKYLNTVNEPNILPDNLLFNITEDALKNIWIITETGTAIYDKNTDKFTPVLFEGNILKIRSFFHAPDALILGGAGALYKYDYKTKVITKIPLRKSTYVADFFTYIGQSSADKLIIGTRWNGAWIYNQKTFELSPATFVQEKKNFSYFIDKKKNLWVSPYGQGVLCFSAEGKLLKSYTTENSKLSNNVVLDIEETGNEIWFATDGGGISILNTKTNTFSTLASVSGDSYSFPVNSVFCLYKDNEKNMWAGTIRGGLLAIKKVSMKIYKDVPRQSEFGLSEKTVLSIYEDKNGIIWLGTDGGGINRFDPKVNKFRHYTSTSNDKVVSITDFDNENLLISFFSKGVYVFNKASGNLKPFIIINKDVNDRIFRTGISTNLNKFDKNKIHLFADNVYMYDIEKNEFSDVTSADSSVITQSSFLQINGKHKNVSYLAAKHQILALNNSDNTLKVIYSTADKTIVINTVCEDNKGNFWIGTNQGLECFNITSKQSKHIDTKLFKEISSLVYDTKGRLWIGVQGMLFAYIIEENKFVIFGESDGALPNEYLGKSALLSQSGDVYMGGVMGLLRIDANIKVEETAHPVLKLADVSLDGILANDKIEENSLSIPWNHTSLVIKVISKEKDIFREKAYRYQIVGLNRNSIESYSNTLPLYSLPIGKYDIMVSCNNKDGSWSEPLKVLTISVIPPWWRSWWFILLVLASVVGITFFIVRNVIREKQDKLRLEKKEFERQSYEEKVRFLINISHELRTPLTLIYAPLKRILQENELPNKQLQGVFKQAEQMKNIINMVLDMRKIEVGQEQLHLSPHNINEWIISVAQDFKSELDTRHIALKYELDESLNEVSFDKRKCEIVLSNLLMNALKFSRDNSQITIGTEAKDSSVVVKIKDHGIGLDGVDVTKLFTRFYQGNHDRKGSGIGLSYSKKLIEMHGGSISANNNEGEGATFWFELPQRMDEKNIPCKAEPYLNELFYTSDEDIPTIVDFSTANYSVLVVEDAVDLRNFLKENLSPEFKRVYVASDGVEALEMIKIHQPDIVVSDVMMPYMNGFELCKTIKQTIDISHIPVILLTARVDSESQSLGYKLGADAYISKPFDLKDLLNVIKSKIKNRETIKNHYLDNGLILVLEETTFSNSDEKFLVKLNKIITDNLGNNDLNVKLLTEEIGMSKSSLYNKIKKLTDMGISDYINNYRIEIAAQKLIQTDMNIVDISDMLGFSNQRYFSTAFKQAKGCSPSTYRDNKGRV